MTLRHQRARRAARACRASTARCSRAARARALRAVGHARAELSLALVGDAAMAELNAAPPRQGGPDRRALVLAGRRRAQRVPRRAARRRGDRRRAGRAPGAARAAHARRRAREAADPRRAAPARPRPRDATPRRAACAPRSAACWRALARERVAAHGLARRLRASRRSSRSRSAVGRSRRRPRLRARRGSRRRCCCSACAASRRARPRAPRSLAALVAHALVLPLDLRGDGALRRTRRRPSASSRPVGARALPGGLLRGVRRGLERARRARGSRRPFAAAALWVALEHARTFVVTGLPVGVARLRAARERRARRVGADRRRLGT